MFQKLISRIAAELNKRKIPYMIIGGHAVILYGEPRLTRDIDITLGVDQEKLPELLNVCKKLKFKILPDNVEAFVNKTMVLPVVDTATNIRVEFIFSYTLYEKTALNRVNNVNINGTPVCFASCEDIIVHKIFAQRPRDIEDVKSILLKNKNIDKKYIRKWLTELELTCPDKKFVVLFDNLLKV
ncbi:MAG: nucleotidyl transferase AbiEii/AbiGii toxin family protein [Pseudomonadota bacterium]